MMRDMQVWLRNKKEKGEELPTDQSELMYMFREDKPMNPLDRLNEKRSIRFSKKDYKRMAKWGSNQVLILKRKHI